MVANTGAYHVPMATSPSQRVAFYFVDRCIMLNIANTSSTTHHLGHWFIYVGLILKFLVNSTWKVYIYMYQYTVTDR